MPAWQDVSPKTLRVIPHRGGAIEIKHRTPEITFLGVKDQPDFATLYLTMYPDEKLIELKSLKDYLYSWRNVTVSYERFIDVVFDHLMEVYQPLRLRVVLTTNARGGISSKLTVDSDWSIRGGREEFKDWVGQQDEW